MFRFYFVIALISIALWWPLNYLLGFLLFKRRVSRVAKNMQIVDDYPLLGSALRFMGKNNEEIMTVVQDILSKFQTPLVLWLGPKPFVFIDNPDDLEKVMNTKSCIEKSGIYRFITIRLFSSPVHIWKPHRKQLSLSFTNQATSSFLPIFNQKSDSFVRNVGHHVGNGSFNIMQLSSNCTLDIICKTALGVDMKIQDGHNSDYVEAIKIWLSAVTRRMCNALMHPDFIYKRTQNYRTELDYYARSKVLPEKAIAQKAIEINQNINNNDLTAENRKESEEVSTEKPQVLIDRLLKLHNEGTISNEEMSDLVQMMIFGGHDTSAFALTFAILMLAMHPKAESCMMDELNEVLGDQPVDADLTMEQVNRLVYMDQVIKETLRLFPVVPFLVRYCTEDTQLKNTVIPKGAEVVIPAISAQRRKDIWGMDADEFKPERFSIEASANRSPYAFVAFSNGARNCIGQRFAYISIKVILAKLFRKYRFSTHLRMEDIKLRLEITCKPSNGIVVEVEERN